jgi:hypothetical protein
MTTPKRTIRGVSDIRTQSGSVGRTLAPHEAHMRLCVLEMEKARRNAEKESALARVKAVDARFEQIDTERHDLLQLLAGQGVRILPPGKQGEGCRSEPARGVKGFKITY